MFLLKTLLSLQSETNKKEAALKEDYADDDTPEE